MSIDAKTHSAVNPYAEVNWQSYGHYKAALHAHTTQSDGSQTPADVIDRYNALGYKVLALTDHDSYGPGGDNKHPKKHETTWPWQKFGREPGELGMAAVQGNEVGTDDVLSYFNDYGSTAAYDSIYTWDYLSYCNYFIDDDAELKTTKTTKNALREIGDRNGLAVMAHIGVYPHSAQWYAKLFRGFDSLIGLEVYNYKAKDSYPWSMTLWDELLTALMPTRPVWGFSGDDMHRRDENGFELGYTYQVLLLPEMTEAAVRESMARGSSYFSWVHEAGKQAPAIKSIHVDKKDDVAGAIMIEADQYQEILWISQGRVVAYGEAFSIRKSRGAKQYVRAQIKGSNGYTCTQPFSLPLTDSDL